MEIFFISQTSSFFLLIYETIRWVCGPSLHLLFCWCCCCCLSLSKTWWSQYWMALFIYFFSSYLCLLHLEHPCLAWQGKAWIVPRAWTLVFTVLLVWFQILTENGSQGSQSQIPAVFKSFSISQKENTLNDLMRDRWLCSTSNGKIGLGMRSFLDLRSWFRINEIPSCDICNEAGVKVTFFFLQVFL